MPFEQAVAQGISRWFQHSAKRLRRVVATLPYSWLGRRAAREFESDVDTFLSRLLRTDYVSDPEFLAVARPSERRHHDHRARSGQAVAEQPWLEDVCDPGHCLFDLRC